MSALFSYALSFNGDVSQWNTTDVTNSEHELYVSCSILIQRRCESMDHHQCDRHEPYVLRCVLIQRRYESMEHQQCGQHDLDASWCVLAHK